jgi:hypothetical protein
MMKRHIIPRRLTIRWFTTRGWAFGAAVTFLLAAWGLQPPFLFETYGWVSTTVFAVAGGAMACLGFHPESVRCRVLAVAFTVCAGLSRASALLLVTHNDSALWRSRLIAASVWMFVAYCCWLLAVTTAHVPNRMRK